MSELWFHKSGESPKPTETPVPPVPPVDPVPPVPPVPPVDPVPPVEETEVPKETPRLDPEELLKRIDLIQGDTAYLYESLERLFALAPGEETKVCAVRDMVMARETTNQEMLSLLERMYKDQRIVINTPDMEWVGRISREAGRAAERAGKVTKDWVGKTKDWFRDLSDENWDTVVRDRIRKSKERTLKEKVLEALRNPALDEEDRELILEYMDQLKSLDAEMQDQALDILTDPALEAEEKSRILENLDEINQL